MKNPTTLTQNMVLKPFVLKAINTTKHRIALAHAMGCTEQAIKNYIERNDKKLTQYAPLQTIAGIMGVPEVSELLKAEK